MFWNLQILLQVLNIVVGIVAENVNIGSAIWEFSASISACIADSTLSTTISTSSNMLWVLRQVLFITIDIVAGNVTQEIDCGN